VAGERLEPVSVKTGLADGQFTQVVEGELKAGDTIVTNVSSATQPARATNTNIFMPGGFGPGGPGARQGRGNGG
jgi:HlyD family secretion protein